MFEQTFKNIDDILQKDAGCSSELEIGTTMEMDSYIKHRTMGVAFSYLAISH